MKKILVYKITIDPVLTEYHSYQFWLSQWLDSSEGRFLKEHASSVDTDVRDNPDRFEKHLSIYATMDEKTETFWRLTHK